MLTIVVYLLLRAATKRGDTSQVIVHKCVDTTVASTGQLKGPILTDKAITNPTMSLFIEWFNAFQVRDGRFDYTFSSTTEPNTFALEYERNQGMIPHKNIAYYITVQPNNELCIKNELNNVELARGTEKVRKYLVDAKICMAPPQIMSTPITNPRITPLLEWFNAYLIPNRDIFYTLDNTTDPNTFSLSREANRGMVPVKLTWGYITVQTNGDLLMTDESNFKELARGIDAIKRYLITQRICKQ
jgi:hypothetical protein